MAIASTFNPASIKNIVFDLGGVLLNIDHQKTIDAFSRLGLDNADIAFSKDLQARLFREFETGIIAEKRFPDHPASGNAPGQLRGDKPSLVRFAP